MYSTRWVFETTLGKSCYVYMLKLNHFAAHEVSVMDGRFH